MKFFFEILSLEKSRHGTSLVRYQLGNGRKRNLSKMTYSILKFLFYGWRYILPKKTYPKNHSVEGKVFRQEKNIFSKKTNSLKKIYSAISLKKTIQDEFYRQRIRVLNPKGRILSENFSLKFFFY